MKKLTFLTETSVFAGKIDSGVAEVVDTLANSLTNEYEVTVVCKNGGGGIASLVNNLFRYNDHTLYTRFAQVDYYLVDADNWDENVFYLLKELKTDIFHNFTWKAHFINAFDTKKVRTILSIDDARIIPGTQDILEMYDYIITCSDSFKEEILTNGEKLGQYLQHKSNFHSAPYGISEILFNPNAGVLLFSSYDSDHQAGKQLCKYHLMQNYSIEGNPIIYSMMCRMVPEKNIEGILEILPIIQQNNGYLIMVGVGNSEIEKKLLQYKKFDDRLLYINKAASPIQGPALLSGSDFYLSPSIYEPCGLMPMSACAYGTIPIINPVGGLKDNFNDNNAIIIKNSMEDAIYQSIELYKDKQALSDKRKICMGQEQFFWKNRKMKYIELYEA